MQEPRSAAHSLSMSLLLGTSFFVSCDKKQPPTPPAPPPTAVKPPEPKPLAPPPRPPEIRKAVMPFQLPTKNVALFTGEDAKYFMFVDRSIQGASVQVWEGGQYGFVRDPKMAVDGSIVFTRFHEGMDVAPLRRDAKGEPLDEVTAIADGTVKYTNATGKSNYGNYVILEHLTEDGPFYSLYAHLHHVVTQRGAKLTAGTILGIMGHTGSGVDRRRAHTHVELNLMLNPHAAIWESDPQPVDPLPTKPTLPGHPAPKPPAPPALNGQNLVGLDIAGWMRAYHSHPSLTLAEFIGRLEPYFKIRVPCQGRELEIAQRYPWLRSPGPIGASWEISIAASSIPLKIEPLAEKVDFPNVSWVQPFVGNHAWKSREMLTGSGHTATLSQHGLDYLKLLLGP